MRKIEVKSWIEGVGSENPTETNTLKALEILLANKKSEDMPRGLDNFRFFNRLYKAFEDASDNGFLILEEADYSFLKRIIEKDIPATWGFNPDISQAFELFLNAEEVKK